MRASSRRRRLAEAFVLAALAARHAGASETVEGTVYAANARPVAGTAPGDARQNVVGAAIAWLDAPSEAHAGWTLRFGAALQHRAECAAREPSCAFPASGDARIDGGAHARAGWFWRLAQVEGGVLAFGKSIVPDVVGRLGTRRTFLALGHGTWAAPTILAPMLYVQAAIGFAERWATALTGGIGTFTDLRHDRLDLAMRFGATKNLRIGEGLSIARARLHDGRTLLGGEARLEVAWTF